MPRPHPHPAGWPPAQSRARNLPWDSCPGRGLGAGGRGRAVTHCAGVTVRPLSGLLLGSAPAEPQMLLKLVNTATPNPRGGPFDLLSTLPDLKLLQT